MSNTKTIQKLRQQTGAGMMDIKKALQQAAGDETKALEILKQQGLEIVAKKTDRQASQGIIDAYVHANGKVASLVMLACETDFVAKNKEFKELAHDLAMQVAAMNAKDVPALLNQNFIKDESKTINDLITEKIAKLGEKIEVREFFRMSF